MSENWNKNHLHNRLDSLFSDLGENDHIPGLSIFDQLTGWMWEIDLKGQLTNLSPDIETHLGYDPATLIGQGLSKISTFDLTSLDLPTDPETIEPAMHKFTFFRVDGGKNTATCQVMPLHNQEQELVGWRGITLTEERKSQSLAALSSDQDLIDRDFSLPLTDLLTPEQTPAKRIPVPSPSPSTNGEGKKSSTGGKVPPADILSPELAAYDDHLELAAYEPSEEVKKFLLEIDSDPDRVWGTDEIQLVEQVHSQLELALENANLFQQTQAALSETDEQARRLRLLNELSETLAQADTREKIYKAVTDTSYEVFRNSRSTTAVWTEDHETLQVIAAAGQGSEKAIGAQVPKDEGNFWEPIRHNRIDVQSEVNDPKYPHVRSSLTGPIFVAGELHGIVQLSSATPGYFDQQDETFMFQLLSIVNASLENRDLLDGIQRALASTEEQ
ncbi:MAG: GAF domain-containing protein, partial [Anaerolineales bacterium]